MLSIASSRVLFSQTISKLSVEVQRNVAMPVRAIARLRSGSTGENSMCKKVKLSNVQLNTYTTPCSNSITAYDEKINSE